MSQPSFEFPVPEHSRPQAFWSFLLIICLVVFLQLRSSMSSGKDKSSLFVSENMLLEQTITLRTFMEMITPAEKEDKQRIYSQLDDTVSRLVDLKENNMSARELYVIIRHEQEKSVPQKDLETLAQSQEREFATIGKIYLGKYHSGAEIEEAIKALNSKSFLITLAKVHAYEMLGDSNARQKYFPIQKWVQRGAFFFGVSLLFFLGIVLLWVYLRNRRKGVWKPEGHPASLTTDLDADRAFHRLSLYFLIFLFLPALSIFFKDAKLSKISIGLALQLLVVPILFLLIRAKIFGKSASVKRILGETKNPGKLIAWGIGGALANLPIAGLLGIIGMSLFQFLPEPSHPAAEEILKNPNLHVILVVFATASILAPILEEFTFRGLMLPALTRKTKSISQGILYSSLIFAAVHPQGLALWLPLAGVGAVSSILVYQTRSLIPSMVMHAVHNTIMTIMILILT